MAHPSRLQIKVWQLGLVGVIVLTAAVIFSFVLVAKPLAVVNQKPAVAYLSTAGGGSSLWRIHLDGSDPIQLSAANQRIMDFAPAPDGQRLAYAAENTTGGVDLWLVERSGGGQKLVLACERERCHSASWSADGKTIAYIRQTLPEPFPRVWLVELATGKTYRLVQDGAIYGSAVAWSPDGQRLSFYDPAWKTLRLMTLASQQMTAIASQVESAGSWSWDGLRLFYTDLDKGSLPPRSQAYQYDVIQSQVITLFTLGEPDLDYSLPMQAPDGSAFLVGRRLLGGSNSIQLWFVDSFATSQQPISVDFLSARGAYRWHPAGEMAVFQQLALGASRAQPEVMLWERSSGRVTLLARQAAQPAWLP